MPFVRIANPDLGFIWKYRNSEVVDLNIIRNTRMLIIMPGYSDIGYTCKVPSLDIFNETGTLEHLEICELDVKDMPKIPDSVRRLEIRNTNITNLTQINANWGNIGTLILDMNKRFTGSFNVPDGVTEFAIVNQRVGVIRLPSKIRKVQCGPCVKFTQLVGEMPTEVLNLINVFSNPYKKGFDEMEKLCGDEVLGSLPMYEEIICKKWHGRQIQYIKEVNTNINYSLYKEFGSIPKRMRVSTVEDMENPIVVAMNLASNYPRRMAEFFTERTTVRLP